MLKILRYSCPDRNEDKIFEIVLPIGARVLTAHVMHERGVLWALINPEETRTQTRRFEVFLTNEEIEERSGGKSIVRDYICTVTALDGYVFHIFERVNERY